VLRGYRDGTSVQTLMVPIPEGLPAGTVLTLVVGNPAGVSRALGNPQALRLKSVRNLETYLRILGEQRSDDYLEAVLFRSTEGAVAHGTAYSELPPTAANLLASKAGGPGALRTRIAPLARVALRLEGPVDGSLKVRLTLKDGASGPKEH